MKDLQKINETIEQIRLELDLNYDEKSVHLLENQIDWLSEQNKDFDFEDSIPKYALYFGQCLVKVYGGKWIFDPSTQKQMIAIKPIMTIDPVEVIKAYYNKKQFTTSFYLFFKGLSQILTTTKSIKQIN